MRKFNKIFSLVLSVILTLGTTGLVVKAEECPQKQPSITKEQMDITHELMDKFPEYKKSVSELENGKLAASNESYIKYTPKKKTSKSLYRSLDESVEFDTKVYTKEEYLEEISHKIIRRDVGDYEVNNCSWLKLDLQVHHRGSTNEFMAYSFFEWKTAPIITFEDGHGISTSSNLIIGRRTNSTPILGEYRYGYSIGGYKVKVLQPKYNDRGVVATFDLDNAFPEHLGMVMAPIDFISSTVQNGRIFNTYLHKQISIGGIGIDATGLPNLSIGGSTDSHTGSVYVSNTI